MNCVYFQVADLVFRLLFATTLDVCVLVVVGRGQGCS